jgi:quinol monooxygenase YgiN
MRFVQIIKLSTDRADEIEALHDEWRAATEGQRTALRQLVCEDRDHPGDFYVIVEFADRLAAEQNDQLPATGQVAGRIAELATAGPEFVNLDVRRLDED